jgi:predicted DNA-binding transcriptional regulator YafY
VRLAIREFRKMRVTYADAGGRRGERTIWPIAMAYYGDATVLGAWCQWREDDRHFRVERIVTSTLLDARFPSDGGKLMEGRWAQPGPKPGIARPE